MAQVLYQLVMHSTAPQPYLLLFPLLLLLLPIVLYLATTTTTRTSKQRLNKLPSPPRLPLIGHLHLVGTLPHVSLYNLAKKHGPDLMLLHLGEVPTLVVSSPRAAEAILRTHDHVFASRPRSTVTDIIFFGPSDMAFAPYGETWRQLRKLTTTHLLSTKRVQSYRLAREEEVRLVVAKISEAATSHAAVDMTELLVSFSNDVVCRALSGKFYMEEGRNKLFGELADASSTLVGGFNLEDCFPSLAKVGAIKKVMWAKAERVRRRWDELLDKLIDDHSSKQAEHHDEEGSDFIDILLSVQEEYGLTRDSIKGILVDMFLAGTETSSLTVEYAMAELMRNQHVMRKVQAEVRRTVPKGQEMVTEDDINRMTYLKAVIKETLRLHPPGLFLVPRLSVSDCVVDGYTIPSGTRAIVNTWAIGRDPSFWEAPEEFIPERFIGDEKTEEVEFRGKHFQFLPFGTGRRICPGMNFAMASIEVVLAHLMYWFDWELEKKGVDMTEVFGLTLRLKEKLLLVPKSSSVVHAPDS